MNGVAFAMTPVQKRPDIRFFSPVSRNTVSPASPVLSVYIDYQGRRSYGMPQDVVASRWVDAVQKKHKEVQLAKSKAKQKEKP
jgi:hypothetical protein